MKQRAGYPWLVMKGDLNIPWSIALLLQLRQPEVFSGDLVMKARIGIKVPCIKNLCEEQ